MSVFGVIADQNNSEYEHFKRSDYNLGTIK